MTALLMAGTLSAATVAAAEPEVRHAEASFVDGSGSTIGFARLTQDATGVLHVNVKVSGVAPGLHGIHIHAVGSCAAAFAAAGAHYNPEGGEHGLDNPNGPHAGDLPNLVVNGAGRGHLNATTDRVTLTDGASTLFDADGSAFVIHASPDDQVTNVGNGGSGARVACGVISAS
ncbi:MAG: superoxide dismutase family protein [Chloroflexi bacterium]|nr:superoxide dismutase family protein [Chloroflexota bacterium]